MKNREMLIRGGSQKLFWIGLTWLGICAGALAQGTPPPQPDFPPFNSVIEGFEQIAATNGKQPSLYGLYLNRKTNTLLGELPRDFASKKFFIAMTVSSGELYAGLQAGDRYVYWRQYGKRLALVEPNVSVRSTGDLESKSSVNRLFTDRVLLDVPIISYVPKGGPLIDLSQLLVGQAGVFFGSAASGINSRLVNITSAKGFPQNIELAFQAPARGGILKTFHYSISSLPDNTGYQPRQADERIGYFVTEYRDLGKYTDDQVEVRFINRWHLEKADPSLKLSPPKNPIVFYIEHSAPIRYRRWIHEGVTMWNKAFENIGIYNAIEVFYQDARTGAHMEKDPEDVRYNFIRWLNNDVGTAIGPSRVHPLTGQILDADIVLTDGWIRHFWNQYNEMLPQVAMEGFTPQTLAWLHDRPNWDPRIRLAHPSQRQQLIQARRHTVAEDFGGHPAGHTHNNLIGDEEYDGLSGRISQVNGLCMAASAKSIDLAMMRMMLDVQTSLFADESEGEGAGAGEGQPQPKPEPKEPESLIDGIPEWFVGPLVADLVAHEVGHTIGLRHNFKASGLYSFDKINSPELKGKKPFTGSVMDYIPVNVKFGDHGVDQGDYAMIEVGPYDMWAIEYGYTFNKDLRPILARVSEPELQYATDEDTWGPDPLARRYDFAQDPINYAKSQIELAEYHRGRLIDNFVKDGDSWSKARRGYSLTLMMQTRAINMMANWIGGAFVNRAKKGDPNSTQPIEVVPAETQREALLFALEHSMKDEAYGLTPDLLNRMTIDKWYGSAGYMDDPTWEVHDQILGIQASVLTMIANPTTLQRVFDNEFRTPADEDMITLPEMLKTITGSIWTELENVESGHCYSNRKPLISSLRRNLQREYLERMIDLAMPGAGSGAAYLPISDLAMGHLRSLSAKIETVNSIKDIDDYTRAHLTESGARINKALNSEFIYNANQIGGGGGSVIYLSQPEAKSNELD
jgi:hypothetical protein